MSTCHDEGDGVWQADRMASVDRDLLKQLTVPLQQAAPPPSPPHLLTHCPQQGLRLPAGGRITYLLDLNFGEI